jgi:hypothetical protein
LATAQPILVFFLLRPNNYDEDEAASIGAFFWLHHIFGHGTANISIFFIATQQLRREGGGL